MNQQAQGLKESTIRIPSFGFLSAMANATTQLPYALLMLLLTYLAPSKLVETSTIFLLGAFIFRLRGDWVFWKRFFPLEMDSGENIRDWRSSIKPIVKSNFSALIDIAMDLGVDILLVYLAARMVSPNQILWVAFAFSASNMIGSIIHGLIIHRYSKRPLKTLSTILTFIIALAALEISRVLNLRGYANLLGLHHLSQTTAIFMIIIGKNLLTGTKVIAKAVIAEAIKLNTMKEGLL